MFKSIAIGCDHAGFLHKDAIVRLLLQEGVDVQDFGTHSPDSVDYPDFVHPVADSVESGRVQAGIVLCGSGNGVAMTANKHQGIRAALCWTEELAQLARQHNDANILAVPARFVDEPTALSMVKAFVQTPFEGGRHERRVAKIACKALVWIGLLFALPWTLGAQAPHPSTIFAEGITQGDLKKHLNYLASDELEGRETGMPGQKKAAAYIADQFSALGLPAVGENGTYYQEIAFTAENWDKIDLRVRNGAYKHLTDYYAFPPTNSHRVAMSFDEVVFLGYGIDTEKYSDYRGVDVKGKAVLIYMGEPVGPDSIYLVSGTREPSAWSDDYRLKFRAAHQYGAALVLLIDGNIQRNIAEQRKFMLSPIMRIGKGEQPEDNYANNIFISPKLAEALMGSKVKKVIKTRDRIRETGTPHHLTFKCDIDAVQQKRVRQVIGENVLGYIEGVDPGLRDELVVVTAHYDHLGKKGDGIYNGADDNASGTSTVLEIAQSLAQAKSAGLGPRRSVLCMLVSGEEKGLLGSEYYTENPIFPLSQTIVNVNVDMVGRVDEKHASNPRYIYVIGADRLSSELHEINEEVNTAYSQLELDYTYNDEKDPNRYYYRSDHYNFAERGIPAIFFFSGTHPDYHQITDDADRIQFDKMEAIGRHIFHLTWELANRDKRITVDKK